MTQVEDLVGGLSKQVWQMLDVSAVPRHLKRDCVRLNALGSNFYFGKAVLGYKDLSPGIHWHMCKSVEREIIKQVQEWPRGHFKTTVFSITTPMWWALPFTDNDEGLMRGLGYGDEWILWMRRAHDQNTATLIMSETDDNAEKIGKEISLHYQKNKLYTHIFPEIIPEKSSTWNMSSMFQNRTEHSREGTYEMAGVGQTLQSRHYVRVIEDDLWGEDALYSPTEAQRTIEFHQKVPGLYRPDRVRPGHIGDNLIVGNRWGVNDLNGWVRKNQPSFLFETHAVDGGCCAEHPKGRMIFPEMYNEEKVKALRESFGPTGFAAQYLNNPLDESNRRFQDHWLKHYRLELTAHPFGSMDAKGQVKMITALQHETFDGVVVPDVFLSQIHRFMIVDPCHSDDDKRGRSRHAVLTVGYLPGKNPRIYLLNTWAKRCSFDEMTDVIFARAAAWRVATVWVEVLAGQDGWMYYFREKNKSLGNGLQRPLKIEPLKKDRSPDAKRRRISSTEPMYASGMIWACRSDRGYTDFRTEYDAYESNQTIDLLDCTGYIPQCLPENAGDVNEIREFMRKREALISGQMMGGM